MENILKVNTIVILLVMATSIPAMAAVSPGTVIRSFPVTSVEQGGILTVTLFPTANVYGSYTWQAVETLPAGFIFISSGDVYATQAGQVVTMTPPIGYSGTITYTVKAPDISGTYTFTGTFKDENLDTGTVENSGIAVYGQSPGTVTRSFQASIVTPGATITTTLTSDPKTMFDSYQVSETIPNGFTVTSNTADNAFEGSGNVWSFLNIGNNAITYTLIAPALAGTYTFSGTFKDENRDHGIVKGSSEIRVGFPSSGIVTRSVSPSTVPPNGILTVSLTPSTPTLFDAPGYRVIETLPSGFTYISATAGVTIDGNILTLTQIGSSSITYTLKASSVAGSYTVDGVFQDELTNIGVVAGIKTVRIGAGYDVNGNGRIDRDEAVRAVMDYFSGTTTRQEAISVIMAYFNR